MSEVRVKGNGLQRWCRSCTAGQLTNHKSLRTKIGNITTWLERRTRKAGQKQSNYLPFYLYTLHSNLFFSSFSTFCVPCASKRKNGPLLVVARFPTLSPPPWSLLRMRPPPKERTASRQSSTQKRSATP